MDSPVLSGFDTASVRATDLDDVVALLETADRALGLPREPVREELTWTWNLPSTNLERDTRILRDVDAVIGYGEAIWRHPDEGGGPLDLSIRVHPNYRRRGIGSWLLAWGEGVASDRGSEGVRVVAADADGQTTDKHRTSSARDDTFRSAPDTRCEWISSPTRIQGSLRPG